MSQASGFFALPKGEGEAIWFMGTRATIKAGTETGNNIMSVVEFDIAPGFMTPPHIHHMEEEAFYVLDGEIEGFCGEEAWRGAPGAFIWLPRGVVHGFSAVGDRVVKMLQLSHPAGFDGFVKEAGETAITGGLPTPGEPNIEKLLKASLKTGVEHLAPA